ncbi:LysR family transcriptional regulator [uncultured Sphingomonas sp.]|uniref:LysR family transcriptional regulator n=1 Tax=uncultured Sphingomonas sp. TaxID=158754 RepID=UPI0025CCAB0D|nr:LysR family transcriptional regulator [uncultured Sphingomonas sp.]
MDRFEAMRTLVAAVDGGSLSAASRQLGVPLPTVSRRVSDLEAHLRTQLVVRTSRKLLLTDAGRSYLDSCRQILDDLDDAERLAAGEYRMPRGQLVVTAPVIFGQLHVEPVVLAFLRAYPDIAVRLTLADYFIDLVEHRIDLAVRIGPLPDSGLIATRLGTVDWITCASPAYLAARGIPDTPGDLAQHDCIAFERLQAGSSWAFGGQQVDTPCRFSVNTAAGAIDAALAGAGIVRVLSYQVASAIAEGRLVRVLEPFVSAPQPIHLLYTAQPAMPLKLRAFLDFATSRLRDRLDG